MADTSQVLEFETEDARAQALSAVPETPENEAKIDEIMRAPLKGGTDAQPPSEPQQPPQDQKPTAPPPAQAAQPPAPATGQWSVKPDDLPENFRKNGPAELVKSWNEAQALIERQKAFIKEKLSAQQQQQDQSLAQRLEALEREKAEWQKSQRQTPAQPSQQFAAQTVAAFQSRINDIRKAKAELAERPDYLDEDVVKKRHALDDMLIEELAGYGQALSAMQQQLASTQQTAAHASETAESYQRRIKAQEDQRRAQEQLRSEYKAIDEFAADPSYPEFKFEGKTDAATVESEYLKWMQDVTNLFYGQNVNIQTKEGRAAAQTAMNMLERKAPDIMEKCRMAGVPAEATPNVRKYLEICDLMNYRDGERIDPATGRTYTAERYHAPTGKMVPDVFPSLKAAYEYRKVSDGFYAQKIQDAYKNGGQQMASAIARRDSGATELDNASGTSRADTGLSMSIEDAQRIVSQTDEIDALRQRDAGKPEAYNKLIEAAKRLGIDL